MMAGASAAADDTAELKKLEDIPSALLIEANSMQTIWEKEADAMYTVAGLSKIPALLVICEAMDSGELALDQVAEVSRLAASVSGPTAFLSAGERISLKELVKAAVMISAGDAIMTLAESLCGTEAAFISRVNARMKELRIDLSLENVMGRNTKMNAQMLAKLGRALQESKTFTSYCTVWMDEITHENGKKTDLVNANRMLRSYGGCIGLITGSSQQDGYCGVFAAKQGNAVMLCVILGASSAEKRFAAAAEMLDMAAARYKTQTIAEAGEVIVESVPINGGTRRAVNLIAANSLVLLMEREQGEPEIVKNIPEQLDAPFTEQAILGNIIYRTQAGAELGRVELRAQYAVDTWTFRDAITEVLMDFLRF
jgi:D-alanyl-D-alanine carboxypeptidase (penicillin-binding protein 5/6)